MGDFTWNQCPLCSSPERRQYVHFDVLHFDRCGGCGLVYKSFEREGLRPRDFYERSYFHGRRSGRDRRFAHRVRKAMREIRRALEHGPAASVLDVGCSFGYVIEAGKRLGMASAGVDVSEYAVSVCRERGYRAKTGSIDALPFEDGEFDLVVMKHVLEHTPSPADALGEVRRVLSPRGRVIVAVPDLRYWKGDWLRRTYRYFRPDDLGQQHFVYYTDELLARLLRQTGFAVEARSKAVYRRTARARGALAHAAELLRFAAVRALQAVARALRLRRELFVIARVDSGAPEGAALTASG